MTVATTFSHTPEGVKRDIAASGDADAQKFSIRELCEAFDVTPRALRFYESQGLISPQRDGQRRIYDQRDRARLFLVLRCKRFGFSLAEIRDLLELYDVGDRQYTQLVAFMEGGREKLAMLEERRRDIEEAISELTAILSRMEAEKLEMEAANASVMKQSARARKKLLGEYEAEGPGKRRPFKE